MTIPSLDLIKIDENERNAILAHCSRTTVGFLSLSDLTFFGSGVILRINDTWTILTAAHVVTAAKNLPDCKIFFPHDYLLDTKYPVAFRDYKEILSRVSNARSGYEWNIKDLDLGLIIPDPSVFNGLDNLIPIDIDSRQEISFTSNYALIEGFPKRLQPTRSKKEIVSNPIFTQFLNTPPLARKDDIALNWEKIQLVKPGITENAPDAGGMSGGPFFYYLNNDINGIWTADKQILFGGIVHYQHRTAEIDSNCLLAHKVNIINDFISILRYGLGRDDFRDALECGYNPNTSFTQK